MSSSGKKLKYTLRAFVVHQYLYFAFFQSARDFKREIMMNRAKKPHFDHEHWIWFQQAILSNIQSLLPSVVLFDLADDTQLH